MSPSLHEFEKLFNRVWHEVKTEKEKATYLLKLFHDLVCALSETSALHFNTLFARISFISTRFQLSRQWSYALQILRKELKQREMPDAELIPILKACIEYLLIFYQRDSHAAEHHIVILPNLPKLPPSRNAGRFKKKYARVIAIDWDKEKKLLTILDEEVPDVPCTLHYSVDGVNDIYADTLELAIHEIGLPLVLGLTNIDTIEENHYVPAFIVVMPDLLLDVTSIAQAWSSGNDPLAVNIIDLFLPSDSTEAILTGQVANFFLDELIRDTTLTYADLFARTFKIYPIEFVQLSDDKLKNMYTLLKNHFENIKMAIDVRFPSVGIDPEECVIEPSYFSPQYGIKGRLDLYYNHDSEQSASIIELKSSKPFKPNSYGLSHSHYHQTLLYELIIKSVHGPKHHRANYILYSSSADNPLRYAVSIESLQKEAIHNRNELVLLQFRMMNLDLDGNRDIMQEIKVERYPQLTGYIRTNIQNWEKIYSSLSSGEKNYFKSFTAFITREHMLARIGHEAGEGTSGLAGLWLDQVQAKEERYQILRGLELVSIDQSGHQTLLKFERGGLTNPMANFRAGDIAIMYPFNESGATDPTRFQLYRANVISVTAGEVVIKLRNNQAHINQIEATRKWNLEHDLLDSSFRALYQSLWWFISTDIAKRQLIFGLRKPGISLSNVSSSTPAGLTEHQHQLYDEGLRAESLYLLWGPPGTGKTSRMLKSWVWHYFFHTTSRISLIAYTNKAVDEICEALESLGENVTNHYIRIGSRAGTGKKFRHRLLDTVIEPMEKRSEIKQFLHDSRIFVSTVASLQGKNEIFKLIDFDVAIVDEASQILEPTMAGLLTRFRKTILIGDHMQLPAVSAQGQHLSKIKGDPEWAKKIGLSDMGMSYFERIYRLYHSKGWHDIIGILSEQGRMHEQIQAYANRHVYAGQLKCLNQDSQTTSLSVTTGESNHPLFSERLLYIPTTTTLPEFYMKTNKDETGQVMEIISTWQELLKHNNLTWTIGVITPFRAQIASILHEAHISGTNMDNVTVDTVERYQGGARDIIIMSTAVNNPSTLTRIVSLNAEGIDRKLNVAVTRARQQFILVGNEELLMKQPAYQALIGMAVKYEMKERTHPNPYHTAT